MFRMGPATQGPLTERQQIDIIVARKALSIRARSSTKAYLWIQFADVDIQWTEIDERLKDLQLHVQGLTSVPRAINDSHPTFGV